MSDIEKRLDELRSRHAQNEQFLLGLDLACAIFEPKLKIVEDKNLWFHTTFKLRCKLEKMEKLMRPENTKENDWDAVSRRRKWEEFLANLGEHGYDNFVSCIQNVEQDPKKLSKQINKMYSILNARIHNY